MRKDQELQGLQRHVLSLRSELKEVNNKVVCIAEQASFPSGNRQSADLQRPFPTVLATMDI